MKTKIQHVKDHLLKYGSITPRIAITHYNYLRLADGIYKLKNKGWNIKTIMKNSARANYAKYWYISSPLDKKSDLRQTKTSEKWKNSAVYMIICLSNNKKYIGASTKVNNRIEAHKRMLKNNNHEIGFLQDDYNEFGEENFEYVILEKCNPWELHNYENYYIEMYDTIKIGYNRYSSFMV